MQAHELDFKIIRKQMKEINQRIDSLEHEIGEFKSWLESKFPKQPELSEHPSYWKEPITANQDVEE